MGLSRAGMVFVAAGLLAGCASGAADVKPSYVSPVAYNGLSCNQIKAEAVRISHRVAELSGIQNQKSTNDAVATTVAVVLFWPAVFMVKGDDHNTTELAKMKGEFETLEKVSKERGCNIEFRQAPKPKKTVQTASFSSDDPSRIGE